MEVKELRKLPMPKLRDLAKQETELQGVGGMEKEALIKAIAEAKGIPYDETTKDVNAIHSVKHDIRQLQKQKAVRVQRASHWPPSPQRRPSRQGDRYIRRDAICNEACVFAGN